ncbi:MAG: NAD(P)/FAD-dependent oxidoreductase, partial [Clostridia bacterium]|nr:NAD(P)/FAD-dependent oxidoreductase [Clostridia bacterium]
MTDERATHNSPAYDVCVIGGGAAGMMAAISAAELGVTVLVLEKNPYLGKKLRITGKGRCNVTNNCTVQEMLEAVRTNSKFLYGAINRFTPADTMEFFEDCGVRLKTERGRRVFPVSDSATEIRDAMEK